MYGFIGGSTSSGKLSFTLVSSVIPPWRMQENYICRLYTSKPLTFEKLRYKKNNHKNNYFNLQDYHHTKQCFLDIHVSIIPYFIPSFCLRDNSGNLHVCSPICVGYFITLYIINSHISFCVIMMCTFFSFKTEFSSKEYTTAFVSFFL